MPKPDYICYHADDGTDQTLRIPNIHPEHVGRILHPDYRGGDVLVVCGVRYRVTHFVYDYDTVSVRIGEGGRPHPVTTMWVEVCR